MPPLDLSPLRRARRVLVLAVGGGNDSVSTLLLQRQLRVDFGYRPNSIDIAAMLPDCLDYHNLAPSGHPLVGIVSGETTRSVGGLPIAAFPERILAQHKTALMPVDSVYGLSMRQGSLGVAEALRYLLAQRSYDLLLAIDVGGDFIATADNVEVLSPMMDAYMLHALRSLPQHPGWPHVAVPILYGVFGLGTDGESTPEMLRAALRQLPRVQDGRFDAGVAGDFIRFYRDIVEPNRYSRTTDYTLREIEGTLHDNPSLFRARFHIRPSPTAPSLVHYGPFSHSQDPDFFGRYVLFDDVTGVGNPYARAAADGLAWFLAVQTERTQINHELNGQVYHDLGATLGRPDLTGRSLLFGTPSRKFSPAQHTLIAGQIDAALGAGVYDLALVYRSRAATFSPERVVRPLTADLAVVGREAVVVDALCPALPPSGE